MLLFFLMKQTGIPIHSDIRQLDRSRYAGAVDLVCWGDPCQANSNARTHGKTPESPADHFLRIVAECRPRFVLRENPSVTRKDAPWPWCRVRDALEEIGYIVLPFGMRACCVGLYHRRDRLFLLGELQVSERTGLEGNVSEIMVRALEGRQNTDPSRSDRRHPSPRICRGVDGIPHRVDRLKALGNAGAPDVAEKIGHIIMAALSGLRRSVLWFPKRGIMRDFYELHFLLFSLKHGGMSFEQFLAQAKDWAENQVQR